MTIESFQRFVETFSPSACVPVDLVKIARNVLLSNVGPRVEHDFRYQPPEIIPSPFCLVMDGECCLDRLYGGYFGDWVCGGQWNRMVDFLRTFFQVVNKRNIEITVFFNGALEQQRMNNWIEKQKSEKEKIIQVLRHTSCKGTPPPKVWWVAPQGLRTCLRILLRHLKVNVVLTTNDHHQEVMSYLKKYNYHGLLADDPEYIIFDPPRYFSSVQLKLTFKGCLETKEYILNEVTRCLNLHPSRICIVAALLGNHILSESDLATFHRSLCPDTKGKVSSNALIKAVVDYIRNLPSVDDLNEVAWQVFGSNNDERCEKFKQCVQYYSRDNRNVGTSLSNVTLPLPLVNSNILSELDNANGRNSIGTRGNKGNKAPLLPTPRFPSVSNDGSHFHEDERGVKNSLLNDSCSETLPIKDNESLSCRSKFASETDESEISSLQSIREVLGKAKHGAFYHLLSNQEDSDCDLSSNFSLTGGIDSHNNHKDNSFQNSLDISRLESAVDALSLKQNSDKTKKTSLEVSSLPKVSTEVLRMSRERHQKGLMHPYIFQILSEGEIKIPVTFEDDTGRELPSPSLLFRPLRQMLYALLFNQHHLQYLAEQKKEKEGIEEKVPDIVIKEWVWSKSNKYNKPDCVPSMPLGWPVPTVTRLWFGSGPDDNKKRLQAFLTCMRSNTPTMCDPLYVPQHFIILCCVLRYMLSSPEMPFLYKHELDAFLVQAVDPHLMDTEYTQKLEVPLITPRGIMLAAIFMNGVDHAIMANDACGAPISWLMCCPWLFFDGKIFHRKLLKANAAKNLMDLCDNRFEEVSLVEHMRNAIVEGISFKFLTSAVPPTHRPPHPSFPNYPVPLQPPLPQGRGRGKCGHQRVVPRGGQLEVAGVVVGSWGPNYGQGPRSPSRSIPPQIVSVGGVVGGRGRAVVNNTARRGFAVGRGSPPPGRQRTSSPSATNSSPQRLGSGQGAKVNSHNLGYEL
ncbi:constitutive coactivator of PPAR-gamma-like protein 1 homolog [Trichonephila inaurata madagascariensis]|uniref:Constitutive coactivator of PPAR-gamma-like protein 1 homolog n=1 Tax=Trichonephila inaurata madagascariensis TaxID=2747483 RepID=A0A8X7BTY3_9ARAC|nr:constitutive coactivator of PPAR-gamma-like protein 1 homolog [Trichonephila inaurata madagascariensis]